MQSTDSALLAPHVMIMACGEPSLDRFLERYAWQSQARYRLGVTYVAVDDATRCAGE